MRWFGRTAVRRSCGIMSQDDKARIAPLLVAD